MAWKSRLSSRPATVSDPVVGSDSDSDLPEAPSQGWDPNLPSTANNTITSQKKLPIKKRVIKLIELSSDDCEDNTVVSLESGNSMFSGKNKKSRITPIKPKIATPPLKTRSSSGIDVKSTNQVKTSVRKSRLKRVAPIVESDSTDGIGNPPLTPSRIKRMHLPKLVVLPSDLFDKLENALHNPLTPTKKNKDIGNVSLLSKPEVKSDLFDCKNEINSDEDTSFLEDEESVLADPDAVFHGQSPPRIPGKLKGKGRDRIAKQSDIAPVPAEIQEFPDLLRALMLSSEEMKAADPDEVSDFPDLA
ncbi:hypothetical protein BDZ94DRAFT_1235666 [Collybia nuda]|uniref:Uncharacterized protein n=1 Tax=Collybia nuda TaxID=64659 RepID=A0A9P6CJ67_9AGAR|nr:hypothetical protein BDZ94DRAFT_1235666 [Collybia nuda]